MKERSIREVIAHLEAQTEQLREREAWHAQQEAFHQTPDLGGPPPLPPHGPPGDGAAGPASLGGAVCEDGVELPDNVKLSEAWLRGMVELRLWEA